MSHPDVVVIGAGLAGLACAVELHAAGRSVQVLEASDGVGGRVRTDHLDGFTLDRGFQVLLTAYPEAQRALDLRALDLRPFQPGALVHLAGSDNGGTGRMARLGDPRRMPSAAIASVLAPVGSVIDKLRLLGLQRDVQRAEIAALWQRTERSTNERLRSLGFSSKMMERFLRPFFAGVFLDPTLSTSSRAFDFVFRMLSDGENAIPAAGMQAIPEQLAARLPEGTIRLGARVTAIDDGAVTLADGSTVQAATIVVATEGPQASALLGGAIPAPASLPVSCLYFAADEAPVDAPVIVLNGNGTPDGPVNNLCVPSVVAPTYAPSGSHLISASVLATDARAFDPSTSATHQRELERAVRTQLRTWFGGAVDRWQHLRTYDIAHAQPGQVPPALSPHERPVTVRPGVLVCGDHRDQASIQGALVSGRRAAAAVLAG